jgi:hypothetical protein
MCHSEANHFNLNKRAILTIQWRLRAPAKVSVGHHQGAFLRPIVFWDSLASDFYPWNRSSYSTVLPSIEQRDGVGILVLHEFGILVLLHFAQYKARGAHP